MEKIVQQGMLYDFYGELLTEHQKQIYESYVYENLSLSESAEEEGVSRQAVHDIIKRCDKILFGYEEKLGLVSRFQHVKERIREMNELTASLQMHSDEKTEQIAITLQKLSAEILADL